MKDMMEQKNKLAYDNGRLQTEVQELRGQVDILKISSTDAEQLRAKNSSLQSRYDFVRFKIIFILKHKNITCTGTAYKDVYVLSLGNACTLLSQWTIVTIKFRSSYIIFYSLSNTD